LNLPVASFKRWKEGEQTIYSEVMIPITTRNHPIWKNKIQFTCGIVKGEERKNKIKIELGAPQI